MKTKGSLALTLEEISKAKHLAALGFSMRHIGREMKRSPHAIARLLREPDIVKEVADEKLKLADMFERLTHQTLESITLDDIKKASLLQRVTSAGIMVDKTALLRNQPTAIVDVRVLLDVAAMIRRDEDGDVPRPAHTITLSPATQPEQTASDPIPVQLQRLTAQPDVARVIYRSANPIDDPQDERVLMRGLGKH